MYLISLIISLACFATSFTEMSESDLLNQAPLVVHGMAGKSYSDWEVDSNEQKKIYTYTDVEVFKVLKGELSEKKILLQELGGEKDGIGLAVDGAARFTPGEEVVLALRPTSHSGVFQVFGMMKGKIKLEDPKVLPEIIKKLTPRNTQVAALTPPPLNSGNVAPSEQPRESQIKNEGTNWPVLLGVLLAIIVLIASMMLL